MSGKKKTRTLTFLVTITQTLPSETCFAPDPGTPSQVRLDLLEQARFVADAEPYGSTGKAKVKRLSAGDVDALERRRAARKLVKTAPRVL